MTADALTAEEIRRALAASRGRLLDAIRGVTEEQFKKRPPSGGWCIAEVLASLLSDERLQAEHIRLALRQDGAAILPTDPGLQEATARAGRLAPVPQLIHGLLAARREVESLLDQAATADGFAQAVTHPQQGRRTIATLLREHVAAHESAQASRIEALKAEVIPLTQH